MTRDELIQAIADNLNLDCMSAADAALAALTTIEGLGFVIVPRVPNSGMYLRAGMHLGEAIKTDPALRLGDCFRVQWDGAIAGSPLYRDGVKG